jgi:hypothetical protein
MFSEMPEDFAPRGPALAVCPSRLARVWKRIAPFALLTLLAAPALWMGGRYAVQWVERWW